MSIAKELIRSAGGPVLVSRHFVADKRPVTPQAVSKWGRTRIPSEYVMDLIGLCAPIDRPKFKPELIRPDVFKAQAA